MKNIDKQEDDYFGEIMSKSKLEMPFPDFEDKVMALIEKKDAGRLSVSKEIRLSWIFFTAGTVSGIIISWILPRMQEQIFGIDPKNLAICFQIIFVVLLFTQIETLLDLIKKVKAKEN
jgi:hypothetical protein